MSKTPLCDDTSQPGPLATLRLMHCRMCLYDLSRTEEPRCPECGCSFNPQLPDSTTLPTANRLAWAWHHIERIMIEGWDAGRGRKHMYCRACFADLMQVTDDRCPVCNAWFNRKDCTTFRRANDIFTRMWERFRHVCMWRGVLVPLIPLWISLHAVIGQSTILVPPSRWGGRIRLEGTEAVMMGVAWLGLALILHMRYFWGRVEPVWRFAGLGTIIGILLIIIGWGYALVWSIRWAAS